MQGGQGGGRRRREAAGGGRRRQAVTPIAPTTQHRHRPATTPAQPQRHPPRASRVHTNSSCHAHADLPVSAACHGWQQAGQGARCPHSTARSGGGGLGGRGAGQGLAGWTCPGGRCHSLRRPAPSEARTLQQAGAGRGRGRGGAWPRQDRAARCCWSGRGRPVRSHRLWTQHSAGFGPHSLVQQRTRKSITCTAATPLLSLPAYRLLDFQQGNGGAYKCCARPL